MSICNTLGANTLDILLSLGMPWLIKCSLPASYGGGSILLENDNLSFDCIGLASSVVLLNLIAFGTGYNMNRVFGILCLLSYFIIAGIFISAGLHIISIFDATNYTCWWISYPFSYLRRLLNELRWIRLIIRTNERVSRLNSIPSGRKIPTYIPYVWAV